MHPEIIKFWRQNFPIGSIKGIGIEIYFIISDIDYYNQGGLPLPLTNDIIYMSSKTNEPYQLNNKWYSEEIMLKMIYLKPFL